jgi:hypothetical protein
MSDSFMVLCLLLVILRVVITQSYYLENFCELWFKSDDSIE